MIRWPLHILAALAFLLLAATIAFWLRGGWVQDDVRLREGHGILDRGVYAASGRGAITVYHPVPLIFTNRAFEAPFSRKTTPVDGTPRERWLSVPWPSWQHTDYDWSITVPHWMLALLWLAPLILALWLRQTRKPVSAGCCQTCSYDPRAHRPGARCPECGTPIPAACEADAPLNIATESGDPSLD